MDPLIKIFEVDVVLRLVAGWTLALRLLCGGFMGCADSVIRVSRT
jgi:hypothetical protein